MSVSITDGLLGLEATWAFNGVTLNSRAGFPRAVLDGIDASAESDNPSEPAAGRIGEVPTRSQLLGVSYTLSGTFQATTLQSLRAAVAAVRVATSSRTDTALVVTPHATYGTVPLTVVGHPIAFSCPEKQTYSPQALPSPFQRDFVLTFRARDPRAWALANIVTAGAANNTSATITPGGFAPTEPHWVIAGPAGSTLDLIHNGSGRKVRFTDLPLLSGHNLIVDFGGATSPRRTATMDGVDVTGYLTWSDTDWWDEDTYGLAPTGNSLKSVGAGAWTVAAAPAMF